MYFIDPLFSIVPVIVSIGFIVVFGIIIFSLIKGIGQWGRNNASPQLSIPARVVSRRSHISDSSHMAADNMAAHSTSTSYYVTFEAESGHRMEFHLSGPEYGLLAEGDCGVLTFQGTRYLGFSRSPGMNFTPRPGSSNPFSARVDPSSFRSAPSSSGNSGAASPSGNSAAAGGPGRRASAGDQAGSEDTNIEFYFSGDPTPADAVAKDRGGAGEPPASSPGARQRSNADRSERISFPDDGRSSDPVQERDRLAVTWEESQRSRDRGPQS